MPNWKHLKSRKYQDELIFQHKNKLRKEYIERLAIDYSDKAEKNLFKQCSKQTTYTCDYSISELVGFSKFKLELKFDRDEIIALYEGIARELEIRLIRNNISVYRHKLYLSIILP